MIVIILKTALITITMKIVMTTVKCFVITPSSPLSPSSVISRIWPSIARFRPVIATAARAQLTSSALSPAAANDALTAIVALEGVTLRQVFADFLIARSEALNRVRLKTHEKERQTD